MKAREFKSSDTWLRRFVRRNGLAVRQRSNHNSQSVHERVPGLRQWHARLRRRLKRGAQYGQWGRWTPENRFNVDQVPFCLNPSATTTYDVKGASRVWIVGARKDDSKREGSLQICVRLKNGVEQPRIGVIFRGKGLRLSKAERAAWDPRVYVQFQKNAWADDQYCVDWVKAEFASFRSKYCNPKQQCVLFADNLSGHVTEEFKDALSECDTKVHLLKARCTDEIQVKMNDMQNLNTFPQKPNPFNDSGNRQWYRASCKVGNG